MAPKNGKGTAGALSLVAFTRLISDTNLAFNRHLEAFLQRRKDSELTSCFIALRRVLIDADIATFLRRAGEYLNADSLPDGLTDDVLLSEVQRVRELYHHLAEKLQAACLAFSSPISHFPDDRAPQILLPKGGKGTASSLSSFAFITMLINAKNALNYHFELFLGRRKGVPSIATLTELVETDFATFRERVEPYLDANRPPEGLSEWHLIDGFQQVQNLHLEIIDIFAKANSASLVTTRPSTPASSPPSATPASTASPTPRLAASLPPALPAHLQPSGLLKVSDEAVGIPAASPGFPRSPVRPAAEKSHSSSPSPHISDVENPSPPPYITRVKCASPPLHITGTENASPSPPISRAECSSMPHIPEAEDVSPSLPLFEELPPASPPSYSSGVECTSPSLYNREVECLSPPPHHTEAEGASPPQSPLFPTSEEPPITSPASLAPLTAQAEDAFPPQSTLLTASKESRPAPPPSRISGAECASPHSEAVRPPPPLHVIRAECPPPCCTVNAEPVSGSVCTSTADDPINSDLHSLTPPHLQECTQGSSGPARLSEPLDNGPRRPASPDSTAMCMYQEAKPPVKVALVTTAPEDNIISQFSSLLHRQRITAYCLRFGFNCRNPTTPRNGELSFLELQNALSHIIRVIHEEYPAKKLLEVHTPFSPPCLDLQLNRSSNSKDPLRVRGPLTDAPLPCAFLYSIRMPGNQYRPRLILDATLHRLLPTGALAPNAFVHCHCAIPDGRRGSWRCLNNCSQCCPATLHSITPPMGALSPKHILAVMACRVAGVNLTGPFARSIAQLRSDTLPKGHPGSFHSFTTFAGSLSKKASALFTSPVTTASQRFVAPRSLPFTMCSDIKTNFVYAQNSLRELGNHLHHPQLTLTMRYTPPATVNGGRVYPSRVCSVGDMKEAPSQSTKQHLTHAISDLRFSCERLLNMVFRVETIRNSPPLSAPSSDRAASKPKTPGPHWLPSLTASQGRAPSTVHPDRIRQENLRNLIPQAFGNLPPLPQWFKQPRTTANRFRGHPPHLGQTPLLAHVKFTEAKPSGRAGCSVVTETIRLVWLASVSRESASRPRAY
ncbi:uncharacterized protein [Rhodnius prolixus]|uniref:uncharacterized protein n=1 Tax=Rhodnius prolixus TaxID=13249 RepID=UPI003D189405